MAYCCSTCRFWTHIFEESRFGKCKSEKFIDVSNMGIEAFDNRPDSALIGASRNGATMIVTGRDFGCIHHEEPLGEGDGRNDIL